MTQKQQAKSIIKSITRHLNKTKAFSGGRMYGIDCRTWRACYPQMSFEFQKAAIILTGRNGRFIPNLK